MYEKKELVSCIIPVWNGAKYLGEMLNSVLSQTYPFVEVILVDDGSTDGTIEIAEKCRIGFEQKGYVYRIIHTTHKNASAALNRGLKEIHGEYLIWPDSDDILEKDSIKKRAEFLKAHSEYGCVRSTMYYFDVHGILDHDDEKTGDLKKESLFFDVLDGTTFTCCGCYMLRTKELFAIYQNRCIQESPEGQNFQMLLPYLYYHKCFTIEEKLYGVRVHEDSHSRRFRTREEEEKRYEEFEALADILCGICKIHSADEKRKIICWKQRRRLELARKYGNGWKALRAKFLLLLYGNYNLKNR